MKSQTTWKQRGTLITVRGDSAADCLRRTADYLKEEGIVDIDVIVIKELPVEEYSIIETAPKKFTTITHEATFTDAAEKTF
jgi:hypothetical protein